MALNKDEATKKIQDSEKSEFEVFTVDEHTTFLENYKKGTVENEIGDRVRKVHQNYDENIFSLTGKRRSAEQKGDSTEFLKTVIGDYKSFEVKISEHEKQVSDLKEQIKNNTGDEQLKKDLLSAQNDLGNIKKLYSDEKDIWKEEKTKLLSSHERARLENGLDRSLMGIKFKDGITDNVQRVVVEAVKNELLEMAVMVDGKMLFKDKDGNTLINKDNAMNPFTPEEMLKSKLKDIIDEGRKIQGTGVDPKITEDKDGKKTVNFVPSDSVKTKDDLHKDLALKGFIQGTEEYKLAWAKYSDSYKYD